MCISIVASAFQYGWAPTLIAGDDDVHLAAGLRELDDAAQDARDPVHVLGAAAPSRSAHRTDSANHSSGSPQALCKVERGVDAPALRLGQRAEAAARVTQQHDPRHALGMRRR